MLGKGFWEILEKKRKEMQEEEQKSKRDYEVEMEQDLKHLKMPQRVEELEIKVKSIPAPV